MCLDPKRVNKGNNISITVSFSTCLTQNYSVYFIIIYFFYLLYPNLCFALLYYLPLFFFKYFRQLLLILVIKFVFVFIFILTLISFIIVFSISFIIQYSIFFNLSYQYLILSFLSFQIFVCNPLSYFLEIN